MRSAATTTRTTGRRICPIRSPSSAPQVRAHGPARAGAEASCPRMNAHPQARESRADLDAINRPTWARRDTVRIYERLQGVTDPGEQAAIDYVAPRVRGRPILDIG